MRERQVQGVGASALGVCTAVFLVISICSYGLFGEKGIEADVLNNFTVDALTPLVWTQLAQGGAALRVESLDHCYVTLLGEISSA